MAPLKPFDQARGGQHHAVTMATEAMAPFVNGQVEVPTGGQGGRRWWPTKVPTPGVRCVGGSVLPSGVDVGAGCAVWQPKGEAGARLLEAPRFARGDDHDGVVQESIEQRGGGTRNRQEGAPVLERPVARQ